jgi:hypothetical protein
VKASERQNGDLELRAQLLKIAQYQRQVAEYSLIAHESRSIVHYGLQFIWCHGRKFIESGMFIFQSDQNERHHEGFKDQPRETAADATYSSQNAKTSDDDIDW